jgi:hypothetical protein
VDDGAADPTPLDRDEPLGLEDAQGLAHRGRADAELGRHPVERRQSAPVVDLAREDRLADLVGDGVGEPSRSGRPERMRSR